MPERSCSREQNQESAKLYAKKGKLYGPAWVEITAVDEEKRAVTFWAPGNGRRVEVTCEWNDDNVMAACPSTLDAAPDRLPAVGEQGILYLARGLVDKGELSVSLKWPAAYPASGDYRPLRVWPVEILVRGTELETGNQFTATIDALDPDFVDPSGALPLYRDRPLTLWVSQRGASRFIVRWRGLLDPEDLKRAIAIAQHQGATAREKAEAWAKIAAAEDLVREHEAASRGVGDRHVKDFRDVLEAMRATPPPA